MKYIFKNFVIKRLTPQLVTLNYLESINDKGYSSNLVDQNSYTMESLKKYVENNTQKNNYLMTIYDNEVSDYIGNIRISIYDETQGGFGRMVYKKYKGMGYGSIFNEIMKFLNINHFKLNKIKSEAKVENFASIKSHIKSNPNKNYILKNMHYFEWYFNFE